MKTINVNLTNKYSVHIGMDLLCDPMLIAYCKKQAFTIVIIADANLSMYYEPLQKTFQQANTKTHLLTFTASEENKTRETKQQLEDQMFELGCNRDTCVIAIGGGITTDVAGFIAATFCRGIPVVYIPTSLLAMVDASIGGKTGVNTPFGKNLIGAFYQPKAIFSDIKTLATLPQIEFTNGLAEAIKHAIIKDKSYFQFLEKNAATISNKKPTVLEELIVKNCQIKKQIIEQDEKDYGVRQLLNFGHTIGHALEAATGYQLKHGEAIAIGMVAESYISMQLGLLSKTTFKKIEQVIQQYHLPIKMKQKYSRDSAKKALQLDKKNLGGELRFVLLDDIGQTHKPKTGFTTAVPDKLIDECFDYVNSNYSS